MTWWETILEKIEVGNKLLTPGRGYGGMRSLPFFVGAIKGSDIIILSGRSRIVLEKKCFEVVEEAFRENPLLWFRVASVHNTEPFENSVDELVRHATGSQLARGNYISSILEHCGLLRYSMQGNKKGIQLVEK